MSRNGSGTWTAPANSFNPAVSGATPTAADWAAFLADLTTAVSTSIASDGQTTCTALIPFAKGISVSGGNGTGGLVTVTGTSGVNSALVNIVATGFWSYRLKGNGNSWEFISDTTTLMTLTGGGGLQIGSPTGGDKGAGTLNATAVYDDNTLLTCMAVQPEFLEKGEIDTAKWDALVPDRVIPEQLSEDGKTVIAPERVEKRTHDNARLLASMVKGGFDPRDPRAYIAKLKSDAALPGMPTASEWAKNGPPSTGSLLSRMWLALEMMALVVIAHQERIEHLEAP